MKFKFKALPTIVIFLVVGMGIFIIFQPTTPPTAPSQITSGYSEISHYSGAVEVDRFDVDGGGVQARYKLSPDDSLVDLIDFYQIENTDHNNLRTGGLIFN